MQGGTHDTGGAQLRRVTRLARAALGLYGLGDADFELLSYRPFVQVFRVKARWRGEYALRLYRTPRQAAQEPTDPDPRPRIGVAMRSPGVLRSQLAWVSALRRDSGLLVPTPVPTLDGDLVGDVCVEGTPWRRTSTLVKWVPGEHKREGLRKAHARKLGSFVAKMHAHAERYPLPEGSEFPCWDWHWPFGEVAALWREGPKVYSTVEMEVFCEAARRVRERLEGMGEGREVFGLVHRDPKLRNVVFSWRGVGVLDFDLSGLGHYLLDLAVLRENMGRVPEVPQAPLWGALLEGYERARPLPGPRARLERHLDAFQAMRLTAAVNRQLKLLGSESTGQRGGRDPRLLRTTLTCLGERVRYLATFPFTLGELPHALGEFLVV
jgi:Ser/Thr protein kinase RdoA (MazF antagonist)